MTTEYDSFRDHIIALDQDKGFRVEVAQVQTKALLTEIAEQMPQYNWSYISKRVVRNATAATFELEHIARRNPDAIPELSKAAKRLALLWEALAKLQESTTRETALLNAAVNYELAGYQANAGCIAKQIRVNILSDERPSIVGMTKLFLQRRFIQLLDFAKRSKAQPQIEGKLTPDIIEALAVALTAHAFSAVVQFFLAGDEQSFKKGIKTFDDSRQLLSLINSVEESNLVRSISSLLPTMQKRATWTLLSDVIHNQPRWDRYLKLLARGVGASVYGGRSVSELWPSQIKAIEQGLFDSSSNKIVRMPTSAGKTRIAELAIVHTLINNPGAKCIYVAPYRALVSELEQSFLHLLGDLGYRVSSVLGAYEFDDFEELLVSETDILVATPEKLDLLLRAKPEFLENVKLFVLDESHIVHDPQRGVKFELLLTRLKINLPSARILTLSAVVPDQTLEDFAKWFNASPDDILSLGWRPSIQQYAMFDWFSHTGTLRYLSEEDIPGLQQYVPGVIRHQVFEFINPETGRVNRKRFPEMTNKSQIAAELALKFAELGPVLVFCTQPDFVKSVANALKIRLQLLSLTGRSIPSYFSVHTENRSSILASEYLGGPFVDWFKSGIGVHYGDLPDAIRKAVETDFRQRKLRVLIATNTLAQGVNLPVKTVIFHSCRRYEESSGRSVPIPARDYWNIAGRAGRAGEETEGLTIHIAISDMDKRDTRYYFALKDDVEPVESALYQKLTALIQNRLSEEALKIEIDPEILALLVEESSEESLHNTLNEVVESSLVYIQASRTPQQTPIVKLKQVFSDVARNLSENIPSHEVRAVYSSSGLSSTSCECIVNHINANDSLTKELLTQESSEQIGRLCEHLLPVCLSLPEIEPKRQFSGSYIDLLMRWIAGTEIRDLINELASQNSSSEELIKFIDDFFRYRLPWGISGYIRIAAKILDIDHTVLTSNAKYLSSMVKFGLPDAIACWAMSAGIPIRRVAIEMAAAFREEYSSIFLYKHSSSDSDSSNNAPSQQNFLEWLSILDSERLRHHFGLTPPFLDDVIRAIFISSRNPLFKNFTDLDSFLPYEVGVRGIIYDNRYAVALQAIPGMPVVLSRDYNNSVDRNAIAVSLAQGQMGYIPNDVAQLLAPEMDTGTRLTATVVSVEHIRPIRVSIRIIRE